MSVPNQIAPAEELGRGISSSGGARRAERSNIRYHEFLPRRGVTEISVDRLSVGSLKESTAIADARNPKFYGWAVVIANDAERSRRKVAASPLEINPLHADIVLPASAAQDRDEQIRHAQELRDLSFWRPRAD